MLMKADSPREYARSFAQWRAMLPHWNAEADRLRRAALDLRTAATVDRSMFDDAELLIEQVRAAMVRADTLMASCAAGDSRLASLMRAGSEFEALLESFQKTLDIVDDADPVRLLSRPAVISQQPATA